MASFTLKTAADCTLAQTSKIAHAICLPVLYSRIDLSCHHDKSYFCKDVPLDFEPRYPGRYKQGWDETESDKSDAWYQQRSHELLRRQRLLIRTLLDHPEHGRYVKSLVWTYRNWGNVEPPLSDASVWKAFKTLINIRILDFCSLAEERQLHVPPSLFSSARVIRISGQMTFALAFAILQSGTPSTITSLDLDNLQDIGQICKGKRMMINENLSALKESRYSDGTPKRRHPGPMRDHLRQLKGRCSTLEHLALRSVGQDGSMEPLWSSSLDEERYQQWAAFIDSSRGSIRTLDLEQGLSARGLGPVVGHCRGHAHTLHPVQQLRPMDSRFIAYILPVLLKTPWPKLEKVTIRGLGGQSHAQRYSSTQLERTKIVAHHVARLRQALGPQVGLLFEPEASKAFYVRNSYNIMPEYDNR